MGYRMLQREKKKKERGKERTKEGVEGRYCTGKWEG
jgi:hypothetical protein